LRPGLIVSGVLCGLATIACNPGPEPAAVAAADSLLIRDVTVIDAVQGRRDGLDVVVGGDRITAVGVDVPAPASARIIDGTGKVLIPGLWDAHVHLTFTPEITPVMFPLFIANGVTSVRDTGGRIDRVLPLRRTSRSGQVTAPRVFIAGPLLDGPHRVYDGASPFRPDISVGLANPEEAVREVDSLAIAGVDLIKAYEMLSPDVFAAIVARAADYGLLVTGHVPLSWMRPRRPPPV